MIRGTLEHSVRVRGQSAKKRIHMVKNNKKQGVLLLLLLLGIAVLSMSSCGQTWDWLWSREPSDSVEREDLILGGNIPEDTDDGSIDGEDLEDVIESLLGNNY